MQVLCEIFGIGGALLFGVWLMSRPRQQQRVEEEVGDLE